MDRPEPVDTPMHWMQSRGPNLVVDRLLREPKVDQLAACEDAMLTPSKLENRPL